MLRPDDLRERLTHVGLNPDDYGPSELSDIAHDIRDETPRGCSITHHRFRTIAERNRRDRP